MSDLPRRAVLAGAAIAPLAACGNAGKTPAAAPPTTGQALSPAADVPVGSGIIVHGTLITQPTAGVFEGFVARCTHAGCSLGLKDNVAVCPCHGSRFKLDGSVDRGPATEPLAPRAVTVSNGEIVVAQTNSSGGDSAEPIR